MNVFLIGELNNSNRILKDACAEIDIVFESSGSISSDSLYLKTMETAALYDTIMFSGGRIGCQVEMSPDDLDKLVSLVFADLTV